MSAFTLVTLFLCSNFYTVVLDMFLIKYYIKINNI